MYCPMSGQESLTKVSGQALPYEGLAPSRAGPFHFLTLPVSPSLFELDRAVHVLPSCSAISTDPKTCYREFKNYQRLQRSEFQPSEGQCCVILSFLVHRRL